MWYRIEQGQVKLDPAWARKNLVTFESMLLAESTQGKNRRLTLNKSALEDFRVLLADWLESGLVPPLVWSGSFNPRLKRGRAGVSAHAGGWAFDIFAPQLPLGAPAPAGHVIHQLAPIAKRNGWVWGGDFRRPDPMHFQHKSSLVI